MATYNTHLYFSNVLDAADLTVSSEDADNPKGNLQDRDQHSPAVPGAGGTYVVTADAGVATTASAIIIPNHNLYTQGVTGIYVQSDDNAGFASPTDLVGSPGSPHAPVAANEPNWFELFSEEKTERHWRLGVAGATTDCSLGDLYFTKRITIVDASGTARHPGGPWQYGSEHRAEVQDTPGFVGSVIYGAGRDIRSINLLGIPKTVADAIRTAEKSTIYGKGLPWWYHDEYGSLLHVRLAAPISYDHHYGVLWNVTMQVKEEP